MKVPFRSRDAGPRFNVAPLIDICFNLIVFFGLASVYVQRETSAQVELPQAGQFDERDKSAPRRLVITMDGSRRISVAGKPVATPDVERLIIAGCGSNPADLEVRIRADRSVPYTDVKPLILACARQGVANLKFAVEGQSTSTR